MRLSPAALVTVALAACGDGGAADTPIDAARPPDALVLPPGPVDAEVITFNIGMIQTVKGAEERLPHVIAAIEGSGADIVCLQEVYTQYTSPEEVAGMLADVYPHAAYGPTNPDTQSNGLLIVSKVPLHQTTFLAFTMNDPNMIVDRAVLGATAIGDGWGLHVLCTHLQAGSDAANTAIRRDQLRELADFVADNGYADGPTVLLGDFNAGPDPDPTDEECPDQGNCPATCTPTDTLSIEHLESMYGWTDRADETGFTLCTYCKPEADELALLPLYPCDGSQRIDHCFVRGLDGADVTAIDRVLDASDLTIDLGNGETARTLSDHYAVQCSITPT